MNVPYFCLLIVLTNSQQREDNARSAMVQSTTSSGGLPYRKFVECASLDASRGGQVQEAKFQNKFVSI